MAISRNMMERQLRAGGGIMTLEEPRQGYFLGKIVKKAKRAVKKIVKSPLGKAALIGGGLGLLGGAKFLGGKGIFAGGQGFDRFRNLANLVRAKGIGGAAQGKRGALAGLFFDKDGDFSLGRTALTGLTGAGILAPFLMGGDDEEIDPGIDVSGVQPMVAGIRDQARRFYTDPASRADSGLYFMPQQKFVRPFAEGGLADIPREGYESGERVSGILKLLSRLTPFGAAKELGSNMDMDTLKKLSMFTPVGAAKKAGEGLANMDMNILKKLSMLTPAGAAVNLSKKIATMKDGGMIDMGGLEKDYREGGFVPIGAEERADDVPARLSKNEFVFTADAVRNAGGGDIDKGAEVMQNMMDNLEAGGMISEESQGKENPAQAMFDQAQMLESRIV